MGQLTFVAASQLDMPALLVAFNRGFEGYYLPMQQSIESLTAMIEGNDVSLSDSVVVLDGEGAPVGLGLLGVRPPVGWVGGMGVAPAWRGMGQGAALLRELIQRCRTLGLRQLQLEVLDQNTPARRLYSRMGFIEQRPLLVYTGPLVLPTDDGALPLPEPTSAPIAPAAALAHFALPRAVPAPWQRDHRSLAHSLPRLSARGIHTDGTLVAVVLYHPIVGGIAVLAAASAAPTPESRAAHIAALLRALVAGRPTTPVRAINVPPGDPLGDALTALACPVVLRQREMVLDLA
jgi:GNAT superfamily N-acetyltransferase